MTQLTRLLGPTRNMACWGLSNCARIGWVMGEGDVRSNNHHHVATITHFVVTGEPLPYSRTGSVFQPQPTH
jgi:hypothetical protein